MDIRTIATVFFSILLAHRAFLVFYRLYLHPLATFPGPRLAAVSTLYRAYYQFWRDGKLLHKTIKLHKKYGPVIRISPNELDFCDPAAYFDIYSTTFNGRKDPDFYNHLRVEADTILLIDDDTGEHKARFQPLASLFSSRQYGQHESNIAKNVERFSSLLSCSARKHVPCRLAAGYRSLSLGVMNDFVFSDIPDNVKPMASVEFDDPLTIATGDVLNWTLWLTRNFPALSSIIMRLPSSLVSMVTSSFEGANQMVQIISQLVEHEKNHIGPKSKDCVMQRLLNAHRDSESKISIPTPDATLRSEAVGFTLAGTADPPNILALGTFMAARDSEMQKGLYKELKAIWPDLRSPAPSYNLLHQLPLLRGIIKESIRFTHGVATGPARLVGAGGARIGGYNVPAKAVVAAPSYFVHMDKTVFSEPEKFEPRRWADDDYSKPLVAFSRGRRMCPAEHFSLILLFTTLATIFRRFHLQLHETTIKDFEWNQYISIRFSGRSLQAILRERTE